MNIQIANTTGAVPFPKACKTVGCVPDGGLTYLALNPIDESNGLEFKVAFGVGCGCASGGIYKTVILKKGEILHRFASRIIKESHSPLEVVKNFVMLSLDISKLGIKSQCPFHRYEHETNVTFQTINSWVDSAEISQVSLRSMMESEIEVRERGIVITNDYLVAGYFDQLHNAKNIRVSEILNTVIMRDRDAILEIYATNAMDAKHASMGILIDTLNTTYFLHNNPLHEIQWIVAGILMNHDQFDDRDVNSLLRIAVHFLWIFRDGETNSENKITYSLSHSGKSERIEKTVTSSMSL